MQDSADSRKHKSEYSTNSSLEYGQRIRQTARNTSAGITQTGSLEYAGNQTLSGLIHELENCQILSRIHRADYAEPI